jgi:putative endonuclease
MTRRKKDLGDWGEGQACNFLFRHGFRVVERNYHTTMGEIDIIASYGDDYYFIEVKTRRDSELATDDSITYTKKIRLQKAVRAYCYTRNINNKGIVLAGLIIEIKKSDNRVGFRFYVMV